MQKNSFIRFGNGLVTTRLLGLLTKNTLGASIHELLVVSHQLDEDREFSRGNHDISDRPLVAFSLHLLGSLKCFKEVISISLRVNFADELFHLLFKKATELFVDLSRFQRLFDLLGVLFLREMLVVLSCVLEEYSLTTVLVLFIEIELLKSGHESLSKRLFLIFR